MLIVIPRPVVHFAVKPAAQWLDVAFAALLRARFFLDPDMPAAHVANRFVLGKWPVNSCVHTRGIPSPMVTSQICTTNAKYLLFAHPWTTQTPSHGD